DFATAGPGNVDEVVAHVKQVRKEDMGVISMKLVGEGRFTNREDRQAGRRFAVNNAGVDSVTVGFKNTAEIDEAIENLNLALAERYPAPALPWAPQARDVPAALRLTSWSDAPPARVNAPRTAVSARPAPPRWM